MKTSVIIPHRDRTSNLYRTLESIRAYWNGEIVVADYASREVGLEILARRFETVIYRMPQFLGCPWNQSTTRNAGAAFATGDLLVFNDADLVHEPGAIGELERCYETDPSFKGIVSPQFDWKEGEELKASTRRIFRSIDIGAASLSSQWLYAWSTLLAVPRPVFNAVGGFDQAFYGWGLADMDFALRASRIGVKFLYLNKGLGVHWPHDDQESKAETAVHSRDYFERKHGFPLPHEMIDLDGAPVDLRKKL